MGNNSSQQSCPEPVACQSWVPHVVYECEKAGADALDRTIEVGIKKLVGTEAGARLLRMYNSITGSSAYAYDDIFPHTTRANFANYEGFKEGMGDCTECSCSEAAAKIIADCKKVSVVPDAIGDIISSDGGIVPASTANAITHLSDTNESPPLPTVIEWDERYFPGIGTTTASATTTTASNTNTNTNTSQGFDNNTNKREGFDNNTDVSTFTKNAINARHYKFKDDTATFMEDCKNNSYYSMKRFITDEKVILDKLYNYYVTLVTSYASQYLHKEAVAKIINSKIDDLEKIQSKIDSYKTNVHVDNRKNNYQNTNYEFYIYIHKFMLMLYYSLFVLYLIFSNFISEKQYKNKNVVAILAVYLIIPFILSYAINISYDLYIYFLEYYNIKEETKSYADIIKIV